MLVAYTGKSRWSIRRGSVFSAGHAMQDGSDARLAAFGSDDPGTVLPGRIVPDVLGMTTFEVGDPVVVLILVKADDAALNRRPVRKSQWSSVDPIEPSVVAAWLPNVPVRPTASRPAEVARRCRATSAQDRRPPHARSTALESPMQGPATPRRPCRPIPAPVSRLPRGSAPPREPTFRQNTSAAPPGRPCASRHLALLLFTPALHRSSRLLVLVWIKLVLARHHYNDRAQRMKHADGVALRRENVRQPAIGVRSFVESAAAQDHSPGTKPLLDHLPVDLSRLDDPRLLPPPTDL